MNKTVRSVAKAYDRAAPFYDLMNHVYFFGRDKRFRSMLIQHLRLTPRSVVLDLCCGTGLDFPLLQQQVGEEGMIVGVDLSTPMLNRAKKRGNREVHLLRADIAHLPFRDRAFHAVIISFCLKVTPTFNTSITEAARVLRTVGKIGVLANHKPNSSCKTLLAKLIGAMAKIDFGIGLKAPLSKTFTIVENQYLYADFVQLIIGKIKPILGTRIP